MFKRISNLFITGLAVLIPLGGTLYLAWMLFKFADGILRPLVVGWLQLSIPGLGLILTLTIILLTGLLATNIIGRHLIMLWESLLLKTPVVRNVYLAIKQLVDAFITHRQTVFKGVVLVEYPRHGLYTLGFITGETRGEVQVKTSERLVNVFLPTTPNPTSGWLVMVPEKDLIFLSMTVEEGLKLVVSGGVITPKYVAKGDTKNQWEKG